MAKARTRSQQSFVTEEIHVYNILLDEREIFVHGHIDWAGVDSSDDPGVEYRMSNTLMKNLRHLESINNEPILIHIHTMGGEWFTGMMMYDIISACRTSVIILCHGAIMSMGTIIIQGADRRVIMPSCSFMIHNGTTGIIDSMSYKQGQAWATYEKQQQEVMLKIYTEVCKEGTFFKGQQLDDKGVNDYLNSKMDNKDDWILTARQAVNFGFVDGVLGDEGYEDIETIKKYE